MSAVELAREILESGRFVGLRKAVALRSLLRDLPAIERTEDASALDWSYALACASMLVQADAEDAQDAGLRIVQGCLASPDAVPNHRAAAAILLERMGNRPALKLAAERHDLGVESWTDAPAPLGLEVIHKRLELAIPVAGGPAIPGNPFQRQFWTELERTQWVSVSAPTSAGKSFIVKRWFADRIAREASFRGIYLVPTRALIEEVSVELREAFPDEVGVYTIPWDPGVESRAHEIYVMTQERLHFLHDRFPEFVADLLFVDEAQKFADGGRGVLLQRVLGDSVARNAALQVVFASPLSENPELLLEEAPGARAQIASETVTVNQNLVWANQMPRKPLEWSAVLVADGVPLEAGTFRLSARPTNARKRVALVAVALGGTEGGNVVYANGAADAEKIAAQIADALGPDADISDNTEIAALRELVQKTIHREYVLADVLGRGVACHYGNMPLLVRREIERLFRSGALRFLVCTSTLLEGVNLPCRNLFARGPRKGKGRRMTAADFWNLAGRAGRWGKEFEGNIVCIDTSDATQWPEPPRRRVRHPLSRATTRVLSDPAALREYIAAGAPSDAAKENRLLDDVFSLLAARLARGLPLASLPGLATIDHAAVAELEQTLAAALETIEIPSEIYLRHPGISPPGMQRLLDYFRAHRDQGSLLLALPESSDATVSYVSGLARCDRYLASAFGGSKRQFQLALLIVTWMRGFPLARLISDRIRHNSERDDRNVPRDIRGTMQDVEEVARFAAPRYLACYVDVLGFHLEQSGRADEAAALPDVAMMLELGVQRPTEVSLMTLGLSRTAAVALEEHIVADHLSPAECVAWLRQANLEGLGMPVLVREEIERMLLRQPSATL